MFGLFQVTSFIRHHIGLSVQLYVLKEEISTIPLKDIDVRKFTHKSGRDPGELTIK